MFYIKVYQRRYNGADCIGPFGSRDAAQDYANKLLFRDAGKRTAGAINSAFVEELHSPSTLVKFDGEWEDHSLKWRV